MAPDPKLIEVARSAERGLPLPAVRLSLGSQFVIGTPGPSSRFNETSWDPITQGLWEQIRREERTLSRKKTQEAVQARFDVDVEALKEGWGPAAIAPEPDPPENLTIYDAHVWTFGETNCLVLAVMRVRLEAINSWWVGQGTQVTTGGSGPTFFAFVSVPVGQ
jgi:hypothetical protein